MKNIILMFCFFCLSINCFADIGYGNNTVAVDTQGDWTFTQMAYGEMGVSYNSTATTITTANIFYQVTANFTGSELNNVTVSSQKLVLGLDGVYYIDFNVSVSGANNAIVFGGISRNDDTPEGDHLFSRKLSANGDIGSGGGSEIHALTNGDTISLVLKNETNTNDLTVEHANLVLFKIAP